MEEELAKVIDGAWNRSAPGHWLVVDGDRLKADLLQALTAAGYAKRSDTIEECAKVADAIRESAEIDYTNTHSSCAQGREASAHEIVDSLRNLKDKP